MFYQVNSSNALAPKHFLLPVGDHPSTTGPHRGRPKDLNLVANNLRRLEDNGADIREPRSPYLMLLGSRA